MNTKRLLMAMLAVLSLMTLSGCASMCDGFQFGPAAVACAPYNIAVLSKGIHGDLQPGGMLNPDGKVEEKQPDTNTNPGQ